MPEVFCDEYHYEGVMRGMVLRAIRSYIDFTLSLQVIFTNVKMVPAGHRFKGSKHAKVQPQPTLKNWSV